MNSSLRAARQKDIDVTRGLAILLVVYAHALVMFMPQGAAPVDLAYVQMKFLSSFGMPVFFLVSGFVYRVKSNRRVCVASLTLLFMAYACHVAGWLLNSVSEGFFSLQALALPLAKHSGLLPVAIWFLVASAFVHLIYHFAERAPLSRKWLIFGAVAALWVVARLSDRNYFYIGAWAPGLLFLASGHQLAKSGWLNKKIRSPMVGGLGVVASMAVVGVLAPLNLGCEFDPTSACVFDNGTFSVSLLDGSTGFLPLFLLTATIGSCGFWLLAQQLSRYEGLSNQLTRLGRYSLALFTMNAFVLSYVQPQLQQFLPEEVPLWLVVVLPVGLAALQVVLLPWWRRPNDAVLRSSSRLAEAVVNRIQPRVGRPTSPGTQPGALAPANHSSLD